MDVKTDASGNVYFWLPAAAYGISLKAGGASYINNAVMVATGNGGTAELTEVLNASPTDISLSGASVPENAVLGTEIGTFSTVDMDADDIFTYSLVPGEGSDDSGLFTIVGNSLRLDSTMLDHETKPSLSIRVRTTDSMDAYFEKDLPFRSPLRLSRPTHLPSER